MALIPGEREPVTEHLRSALRAGPWAILGFSEWARKGRDRFVSKSDRTKTLIEIDLASAEWGRGFKEMNDGWRTVSATAAALTEHLEQFLVGTLYLCLRLPPPLGTQRLRMLGKAAACLDWKVETIPELRVALALQNSTQEAAEIFTQYEKRTRSGTVRFDLFVRGASREIGVEVDGGYHKARYAKDRRRDACVIEQQTVNAIYRVSNDLTGNGLTQVVRMLSRLEERLFKPPSDGVVVDMCMDSVGAVRSHFDPNRLLLYVHRVDTMAEEMTFLRDASSHDVETWIGRSFRSDDD